MSDPTASLAAKRTRVFALMALVAGTMAACGGGDDGAAPAPVPAPAPTPTPPPPPPTAAQACTALNGTTIAATSISMPTMGATITATTLQAPSGTGATAVGEYCKVVGSIAPVDPAAPPILFQVDLPTTWNGKAFQLTGGGYDGGVVNAAGGAPGSGGLPTPLAKGYATLGSDSGHEGSSNDASFGLNQEALNNYFGDQLIKTHDVAMQLIQTRYGTAPTKMYVAGGSGGGREALYAADRWPTKYDGVIAYYPAWSLTAMILNYGRISVANAAPGAWPNKAKQQLLTASVTSACDALDGATDGVVSNIAACTFDPQTIRCPGGADTGNTCLSDPQIAAVSSYAGTLTVPYPLANGTTTYPAYNVFTGAADLSSGLGLGTVAPSTPSTFSMPFPFYIYEPFIRYWVTLDANYDSLTFNLNSNAAFFKQRLQYISSRLDVTPNLSPFAARSGKVIIVHGRADPVIPTASSEDFYARLVASMGAPSVSSFLKLYEVPGYGHGSGIFNTSWDSVAALEAWVEQGIAPTSVVVRDANASSNSRTRPLCEAPLWPKYNGSGDINLAASYTCSP